MGPVACSWFGGAPYIGCPGGGPDTCTDGADSLLLAACTVDAAGNTVDSKGVHGAVRYFSVHSRVGLQVPCK